MVNVNGTLVIPNVSEVSVTELDNNIVQFNFHTPMGIIPVRLTSPSPEWKGNTLDRLHKECQLPFFKAA